MLYSTLCSYVKSAYDGAKAHIDTTRDRFATKQAEKYKGSLDDIVESSICNKIITALPVIGCIARNDTKITEVLKELKPYKTIDQEDYNQILRKHKVDNYATKSALNKLTGKINFSKAKNPEKYVIKDGLIGKVCNFLNEKCYLKKVGGIKIYKNQQVAGEVKALLQVGLAASLGIGLYNYAIKSSAGLLNGIAEATESSRLGYLATGLGLSVAMFNGNEIMGLARTGVQVLKKTRIADMIPIKSIGYSMLLGSLFYGSMDTMDTEVEAKNFNPDSPVKPIQTEISGTTQITPAEFRTRPAIDTLIIEQSTTSDSMKEITTFPETTAANVLEDTRQINYNAIEEPNGLVFHDNGTTVADGNELQLKMDYHDGKIVFNGSGLDLDGDYNNDGIIDDMALASAGKSIDDIVVRLRTDDGIKIYNYNQGYTNELDDSLYTAKNGRIKFSNYVQNAMMGFIDDNGKFHVLASIRN